MTSAPAPGTGAAAGPGAGRVRAVARLREAAGRRRAGAFLVEGPHAVGELLSAAAAPASRWRVRAVYATPEATARHPDIAASAGERLVPSGADALTAMSDAVTPQDVLAVADIPAGGTAPLPAAAQGCAALLDEVRDPGNVGTVVRAADASGASAVLLSTGCADLYAPKTVRSTAGSLFHVDTAVGVDAQGAVAAARAAGWTVLATAADGEVDLDDLASAPAGPRAGAGAVPAVSLRRPHLWVLGNEARGVSADLRGMCDATVRIPLRGRAESLNLAMAATLVLFASARAEALAARDDPGPL